VGLLAGKSLILVIVAADNDKGEFRGTDEGGANP